MNEALPRQYSLFSSLRSTLGDRLPVIQCSKLTLIHLSHTLEDVVLRYQIPALIFTGFQESAYWRQESARYAEIAQVAQQLCIFAGRPLPPESNASALHIELAEDDPLRQEWFLAILSDRFSVVLCGQDTLAPAAVEGSREFDTLYTFDPLAVAAILDVIEGLLIQYRPERLDILQAARRQFQTQQVDWDIITVLMLSMIDFEETLHRRLNSAQADHQRAEYERLQLAFERERIHVIQNALRDSSHDLRTPLAVLKLKVQMLQRVIHNPERLQHHLAGMEAQVDRLDRMLGDLLDVALRESEAELYHFEPVDVAAVWQAVIAELEPLLRSHQHHFQFAYEDDLTRISGDSGRLHRAFSNLLTNAIHYTPRGGQISVRLWATAASLICAVSDSGIGIDPAELPHIFERLYRTDPARSKRSGGMGLGLPITKQIIERHGGLITVESVVNQGTTFIITLPLRSARPV